MSTFGNPNKFDTSGQLCQSQYFTLQLFLMKQATQEPQC